MIDLDNFNPKKTKILYEHKKIFRFLKNLINSDKMPHVLMLSGNKGLGKSTIINHILHYYFDETNYDEERNVIQNNTSFNKQFLNNIFPNIYYLNGYDFKNIKIEDVRILKKNLLKTSISNKKRFIILDNVETFNINSLNALLKIIEEPSNNNYFFLIDNKSKPLLETIRSRCLEIKIFLNKKERENIISALQNTFEIEIILDKDIIFSSPGNFLIYNYIFEKKKININDKFSTNFNLILNLHRKEKEVLYKDLLFFYTDYYLKDINKKKNINSVKYIKNRSFFIKNMNEYFSYNLSHSSLISSIESHPIYE